jgi:hypothetical protein
VPLGLVVPTRGVPFRGHWPDASTTSEGASALSAAALTREVGATRLLAAWCALGPVASRLFSSPLQSLWPGAWRGLLRSSPPSLWASATASPTLESAPALPAAALPREVAAKAPPTHLYPEPPPPSVSPGLTASSPPTAPASGRAMATQLTSWTRLPCRWSPVALALAAGACGWR